MVCLMAAALVARERVVSSSSAALPVVLCAPGRLLSVQITEVGGGRRGETGRAHEEHAKKKKVHCDTHTQTDTHTG